jgi:hypothetical protein
MSTLPENSGDPKRRRIAGNVLMVPVAFMQSGLSHLACFCWAALYMHIQFRSEQVSIDRLSAELRRSRRQVTQALGELEAEGLLARKPTRGTTWYQLDAKRISALQEGLSQAYFRTSAKRISTRQPSGFPLEEKNPPPKKFCKRSQVRDESAGVAMSKAANLKEWLQMLPARHPDLSQAEIDRIGRTVEFELCASGRSVADFLEFDFRETTNPRALKSAKGYYRDLARRLPRFGSENAKTALEEEEPKRFQTCRHCGGVPPWGVEPGSDPVQPCTFCSSDRGALDAWRAKGLLADAQEAA